MSPLWRDCVVAFLAPGAVRVQRHARGFRPVAAAMRRVPCPPGPAGCVEGLRQALAAEPRRGFDARVVLSNDFVRYAVVPDADALHGEAERNAAARHALHGTFGEAANRWEVAVDQSGGWSDLLAAGVDAEFPRAIVAACKEAGARSVRIEPLLALASHRADVGTRTGWLAVLEPQRIVLATLAAGRILAVRSHRVRGDAAAEWPVLLDQSRLVHAADDSRGEVLVIGEQVPTEGSELPGALRLRGVPLDFTGLGRAKAA